MTKIAPSVLAADFSDLWSDVQQVSSVDLIHLDVMDGHFVPNISFGPPVVSSLRARTDLYFDTHLMIADPTRYLDAFAEAGSDRLTVHVEACDETQAVVDDIHDLGLDAGVAINPDTQLSTVEPLLETVDVVLVMSVEPGFGGQAFIPETVKKIERLAALTDTEIEVDGAVDGATGRSCVDAGADTLVIGSSLFGQLNTAEALTTLTRQLCD